MCYWWRTSGRLKRRCPALHLQNSSARLTFWPFWLRGLCCHHHHLCCHFLCDAASDLWPPLTLHIRLSLDKCLCVWRRGSFVAPSSRVRAPALSPPVSCGVTNVRWQCQDGGGWWRTTRDSELGSGPVFVKRRCSAIFPQHVLQSGATEGPELRESKSSWCSLSLSSLTSSFRAAGGV